MFQPIVFGKVRTFVVLTFAIFAAACAGGSGGDGGGVIDPGGSTTSLSVAPSSGFEASGTVASDSFGSLSYTLTNTGDTDLDLFGIVTVDWLSIEPVGGHLEPNESVLVTMSVDATAAMSLDAGEHFSQVDIVHNSAEVLSSIPARLVLTAGAAPVLSVTAPQDFSFQGPPDGPFTPLVHNVTVTNTGGAELSWQASSPTAWVGLSATSGTLTSGGSTQLQVFPTNTAALQADSMLSGLVFVNNTFDGAGDSTLQPILNLGTPVGEGVLSVSGVPTYEFTGPEGGPYLPAWMTYVLSNTGGQPLNWSSSLSVAWMNQNTSSGTIQPGESQQVTIVPNGQADSLATGTHTGSFTVQASTGSTHPFGVVATIGTTMEDDRFMVVNGEKFFPIYVWNQPPFETQMDYMKSLGVTTYMNNGMGIADSTNLQMLNSLQARGMSAFLRLDTTQAVVDHPALLAWMLDDEPDLSTPPDPASEVQASYDSIRALDSVRPIIMNLTGGFFGDSTYGANHTPAYYQSVVDVADMVSFDHYPVTGWNQQTWVYRPGASTEHMLSEFTDYTKPCWAIIECSDQRLSWTPADTPAATPAQTRFMVWDSVIHGATAIGYFTIAFNPFAWSNIEPAMETEMTRTNGQLTALKDVILSTTIDLGETVTEPSGRTITHTMREQAGVYYLFAANADMGYNSAQPTFSFTSAITSINVIDEGRSITPSGSSFTDSFGVLGVHLYEITF